MSSGVGTDRPHGWRTWLEDGVVEISSGCLLLLGGALSAAQHAGFLPPVLALLVWIAGALVGIAASRRGVRWAKAKVRGQVGGEEAMGPGSLLETVALLVAGLLLILFVSSQAPPLLRAHGVILLLLLYIGWRARMARFFVLALLSVLVSLGIEGAGLGFTLGNAVYFLAMGAAMVLVGAATLAQYRGNARRGGAG